MLLQLRAMMAVIMTMVMYQALEVWKTSFVSGPLILMAQCGEIHHKATIMVT